MRSVHWKISAKRDQLIVRELERPRAQAITLCFENRWQPQKERPEIHRDKLERAVERCAGILFYLMREGYPVALVTLQERTPFGSDLAHQDHLLTVLARLTFVGDPQLSPPLEREPDPSVKFDLTPQDRCVLLAHPDQDGKSARPISSTRDRCCNLSQLSELQAHFDSRIHLRLFGKLGRRSLQSFRLNC